MCAMFLKEGYTEAIDVWAVRFALRFRNHEKWLAHKERMFIGKHVDLKVPQTILEIGPQTGWRTLVSLYALGHKVTALDNWSYWPAWRLMEGVNFVEGDASLPLPFGNETFDHCVFMGAISYVNDGKLTIAEIRRILKPGGLLFVNCNNPDSRAKRLGLFDPNFKTLWSSVELSNNLVDVGYKIEESFAHGFPVFTPLGRLLRQTMKFCCNPPGVNWFNAKVCGEESFVACVARKIQ